MEIIADVIGKMCGVLALQCFYSQVNDVSIKNQGHPIQHQLVDGCSGIFAQRFN